MSQANAVKVVNFAATHKSFRESFRTAPQSTLSDFKKDLGLTHDGLSNEEMSNIAAFNDEYYDSFAQLVGQSAVGGSQTDSTSQKIGYS